MTRKAFPDIAGSFSVRGCEEGLAKLAQEALPKEGANGGQLSLQLGSGWARGSKGASLSSPGAERMVENCTSRLLR